jgi:hypothetical protein
MLVYQYVDSFYIQLYLDLHELEINEMKSFSHKIILSYSLKRYLFGTGGKIGSNIKWALLKYM